MPPCVYITALEVARRRRGFSRVELAHAANVAPDSVARYERGDWPSLRNAYKMAGALGVAVQTILPYPNDEASADDGRSVNTSAAASGIRDDLRRA